ncbi:MAG: hypothetical protein AAGC55_24235, partial [Myxococcota bacterium]
MRPRVRSGSQTDGDGEVTARADDRDDPSSAPADTIATGTAAVHHTAVMRDWTHAPEMGSALIGTPLIDADTVPTETTRAGQDRAATLLA